MTCIPSCACGQEEDAFPSVREALRCLEPYGWRRVPPVTAWTGSGWAAGVPLDWYCPPCRTAWDAERTRRQKDFRHHPGMTWDAARAIVDAFCRSVE